jgi:2-amino-4-hydroxy-6-hydroxymethyldihydropteridine diphosphokinase
MRAGIALGSNLGDRLSALQAARLSVLQIPGVTQPVACSSVYETDPVDSCPDAGRFLNAVMEVDFQGEPMALLRGLQNIEHTMGRPAHRPLNAPRIVDLDILYIGDLVMSAPELTLPHPRLHLRRFVLAPLAEIRPWLHLPGLTTSIGTLLASLQDPAAVHLSAQQWNPL